MNTVDVEDLDWNLLWQQEKNKKTWKEKKACDWDKKAASFARRTASSIYVDRFLHLLQPQPQWSVLDAGCGPGTLALPIAPVVRRVTGLDFSGGMLEILRQKAAEKGLKNITTCHGSWEDDWRQLQIGRHDVALASRSLAVRDLQAALTKLTAHAREKVVITDRVRHGPFDPDAFAAVGRPLNTGPDYIYTLNLLHQMGYLPTVEYIHLEETLEYGSFAEALSGCSWMFRDLTAEEEKRLKRYLKSISTIAPDGTVSVSRRHVPVWAYITWKPKKRRPGA